MAMSMPRQPKPAGLDGHSPANRFTARIKQQTGIAVAPASRDNLETLTPLTSGVTGANGNSRKSGAGAVGEPGTAASGGTGGTAKADKYGPSRGANTQTPPPPPPVQPQDDGPPVFKAPGFTLVDPGIFSWMDAGPETISAAMQYTERFVEWAKAMWGLDEVRDCWREHPSIIFALHNLWLMYRYAYHQTKEFDRGIVFLEKLAETRNWLRDEWKMNDCTESHQAPVNHNPVRVERRRATYQTHDGLTLAQAVSWNYPETDDAGTPITELKTSDTNELLEVA
jgi:hypothetical protein